MKRINYVTAFVTLGVIVSGAVWATPSWQVVFTKNYKPKASLTKVGCMICHSKPDASALNVYGSMLKGKKEEAPSLKVIEKCDADKDKFSNIAEIKAGTLPGDAASKPGKKRK